MPSNPPPFHFGSCRGRIRKVKQKILLIRDKIKVNFAASKKNLRPKYFSQKLESELNNRGIINEKIPNPIEVIPCLVQ